MSDTHPAAGLPEDRVHMLTQPLLTDEGFVNEACMNELSAAIKSMPESYDRLAGDPEWTTPHPVVCEDLVGLLASWAISQMQRVPPDLEKVCNYLHACLKRDPFTEVVMGYRMTNLSLCDVNRILWRHLEGLEAFDAWNEEAKVGANWIDLSALLHNVCISIRNNWRHSLAFNRKFEAESAAEQEGGEW